MRPLLLLLLLTSSVWADPAADALLEELRRRAPDKLFVMRENEDPASPIVALYGDLADPDPDARKSVDTWLAKFGPVLGYPAAKLPSELMLDVFQSAGPGRSTLFMPYKDKHIWTGGTVGFHFDKDHRMVAATNRYRPMGRIGAFNFSAVLAVMAALGELQKKAEIHLNGDGKVYRFLSEQDDGSLKPVYKVEVTAGAQRVPYTILVGAGGEVLCRKLGGDRFDAAGKTHDGYPVSVDGLDHVLPKLRDAMKPNKYWTLDGDHFISKTTSFFPAISKKGRFDFPSHFEIDFQGKKKKFNDARYLETSMYYHLMYAHDQARDMGATEVDRPWEEGKTDLPLLSYNAWQQPDFFEEGSPTIDNAYYSAAEKGLFFGWWQPGQDFRHPAADPSVIYHEYGHYVLDRLNGYYRFSDTPQEIGDTGAISEGFADFFAAQLAGGSTTAEIYMEKERRSPSLTPDYCNLVPIYDGSDGECDSDKGKTEIHDAGNLFSGLALRLVQPGPAQLGRNEKESVSRIFEAMRNAVPCTFRTFALSVMAVEMRHGDHAKLPRLVELFREAGLFKTCGRTP